MGVAVGLVIAVLMGKQLAARQVLNKDLISFWNFFHLTGAGESLIKTMLAREMCIAVYVYPIAL